MNFLKKGPELKLSGLKVPGFLADIYYDLKDRHLLPLTAILLVALVAVPIALSSSGAEPARKNPGATATSNTGQGSTLREAGQLVATSAPGLRDYRRRLRHLEAKDPFKQQYPKPESTESTSSSGATESGSTGSTGSPESIPTSPSPETGGTGGEGTTTHSHITYYSYAIDVRVTTGTSQESASTSSPPKVTVRRNLPELTTLPNRKIPAIIYMGSTRDGKKALMLISSDVDAIFGDGRCALGSQTCELLSMETGVPETFVYGGAGKTFKVELLKIGLVESNKLNKAPLGESPKHGKGN
jgi:hypothetical protein